MKHRKESFGIFLEKPGQFFLIDWTIFPKDYQNKLQKLLLRGQALFRIKSGHRKYCLSS